uniref:Uncharacterized protein n=1 Tax=Lepeophtheirus salmonis TaxID=72036 RepID=A0A0K2U916_LEPSM
MDALLKKCGRGIKLTLGKPLHMLKGEMVPPKDGNIFNYKSMTEKEMKSWSFCTRRWKTLLIYTMMVRKYHPLSIRTSTKSN